MIYLPKSISLYTGPVYLLTLGRSYIKYVNLPVRAEMEQKYNDEQEDKTRNYKLSERQRKTCNKSWILTIKVCPIVLWILQRAPRLIYYLLENKTDLMQAFAVKYRKKGQRLLSNQLQLCESHIYLKKSWRFNPKESLGSKVAQADQS